MTKVVKVLDGGECCTCAQQSGCGCAPYPCTMECRYKQGLAELCGFEPLADGCSGRPRRWRKRQILGTMRIGAYPTSDCSADGPNPGSDTCIWSGGDAGPITGKWRFTDLGSGDVLIEIFVEGGFSAGWFGGNCVGSVEWSVATEPSGTILASGTLNCPNSAGPSPGTTVCDSGVWTTVATLHGRSAGEVLQFLMVGRHRGLGTACGFSSLPIFWSVGSTEINDSWHFTQDYGPHLGDTPPSCEITETDGSLRTAVDGSTGPIPISNPDDYASGHIDIALADCDSPAGPQTTAGNDDCLDDGDGYYRKYSGTVNEGLSEEDLPEAAIARAEVAIADWSSPAPSQSCLDFPSFILTGDTTSVGFRTTQVRSRATGLTIGLTYTVTVKLYRRPLGVGGAWTFYAQHELTVVADAVIETTDWLNVDQEDGYETRPQICRWDLAP